MKKSSQMIRNYVESILTSLETTNSDEIIIEIAQDLKFNLFFNLFMEEMVKIALEKNKLINSFSVLKSIWRTDTGTANHSNNNERTSAISDRCLFRKIRRNILFILNTKRNKNRIVPEYLIRDCLCS